MGKDEFKYKVVILGDFAVGKTSLVRRYVYNLFDDLYLTTIGVRVTKKDLVLDGSGETVTMLLWDIGGLLDFQTMTPQYLQGAAGAIIVADLTRVNTIAKLDGHIDAYTRVNPAGRITVAFNKDDLFAGADLPGNLESQVEQYRQRFGDAVFRTSACSGMNVERMFSFLAGMLRG